MSNTLSTIVDKLFSKKVNEHLTFSIQIQQEGKTCRSWLQEYIRSEFHCHPASHKSSEGQSITFLIVSEHNSSTDFPSTVPSGINAHGWIQFIMEEEKMAKGTAPCAVLLMEMQNAMVWFKSCVYVRVPQHQHSSNPFRYHLLHF